MKKTINVTQKCIDDGRPATCRLCPVALAVKENISFDFSVTACNVNVWDGPIHKSIMLPKKARDFIFNFDTGKKVNPFKFKLDIPYKYLKSNQ